MNRARLVSGVAVTALLLLTFAAYANTFAVPFRFDDPESIAQNASLRQLWPPWQILAPPAGVTVSGRPVANATFALNYAISGLDPWSYHVTNLAIHAAAGLLLFGLVRSTLNRLARRPRDPTAVAFAIAALWLLHPLQTESVTYVVQRVESLCGFFYLATLYAFARGSTAEPGRGGPWFACSAVACALGMATKEVMVSAPLIVLLYDRTFASGSVAAAWRARGRYYLALAATWALLALLVVATQGRGGTAGFGAGVTVPHYALTQLQAIALYLGCAAWPAELVFDYGTGVVRDAHEVIGPGLVVFTLLGGTPWALRRHDRWRVVGFLGAVFFAVLAPSSSFVPVATQTVAEHRMYLPLATLAVAAGGLLSVATRRVWLAGGMLAAALAVVTWQRNEIYRDDLVLWLDTAAKRPTNERAHHHVALVHERSGRHADAVEAYRRALRAAPDYLEAHHAVGVLLSKLGRHDEARQHLEQAARLDPADAELRAVLGRALTRAGRADEAVVHYEHALRLRPGNAAVHARLGSALAQAGRAEEALAQFAAAAGHGKPVAAETIADWGGALLQLGRTAEAVTRLEAALALEPTLDEARGNLGFALLHAGRLDDATRVYRELLRRAPEDIAARNNLGYLALQRGDAAEAVVHYEVVTRLDAQNSAAHYNASVALLRAGRRAEAEAALRDALRLRPDYPEAQRLFAEVRRQTTR